jgi:hypothetical protein
MSFYFFLKMLFERRELKFHDHGEDHGQLSIFSYVRSDSN